MDLSVLNFIFLFLLGLCVGSFLNVLIYRLPKEEEFVRTPSHRMTCGHELKWYELFPVFSWLIQGGKCRACGVKLSAQYPIVEALNGTMWLITALLYKGDLLTTGLYCALFSLLLVITVIDWRTFTIPNGLNLAILILGVIRLVTDLSNWPLYIIGMLSVSSVFLLMHILTGGAGLGMGDGWCSGIAAGLAPHDPCHTDWQCLRCCDSFRSHERRRRPQTCLRPLSGRRHLDFRFAGKPNSYCIPKSFRTVNHTQLSRSVGS